MEEKPRLSRLTAILTQLQSKHIITATELAERHNVSVRTIYRDIRALEQSGIPVITEEGKGYSIMEGFHMPPVLFTEEEANALITIGQLALKNKDSSLVDNITTGLEKIKAILRYTQKEHADLLSDRIYFGVNHEEEKTSNNLMQIQSAITQYKVITIDYQSLKGEQSSRKIEPFAIYSTKGDYLLIAYCRFRNDFRHFRIDCIKHFVIEDETFTPHNMTIMEYYEKYVKSK